MNSVARVGILVALMLAGPASTRAQPKGAEAEARLRFQHGEKLVREGDYAGAQREFLEGYRLSRRPLFLFNMAECARLAGDLGQARAHYEHYLREDPQGAYVAQARERLAALPRAGTRPPAPVPVAKPAAAPGAVRAPAPAPVAPAPRPLATTLAQQPRLDPLAPRVTPPFEPRRPLWKRWPVWVGVGVAVVTVVVTTSVVYGSSGRTTPPGDYVVSFKH